MKKFIITTLIISAILSPFIIALITESKMCSGVSSDFCIYASRAFGFTFGVVFAVILFSVAGALKDSINKKGE